VIGTALKQYHSSDKLALEIRNINKSLESALQVNDVEEIKSIIESNQIMFKEIYDLG